jgi:hypothetical protein
MKNVSKAQFYFQKNMEFTLCMLGMEKQERSVFFIFVLSEIARGHFCGRHKRPVAATASLRSLKNKNKVDGMPNESEFAPGKS